MQWVFSAVTLFSATRHLQLPEPPGTSEGSTGALFASSSAWRSLYDIQETRGKRRSGASRDGQQNLRHVLTSSHWLHFEFGFKERWWIRKECKWLVLLERSAKESLLKCTFKYKLWIQSQALRHSVHLQGKLGLSTRKKLAAENPFPAPLRISETFGRTEWLHLATRGNFLSVSRRSSSRSEGRWNGMRGRWWERHLSRSGAQSLRS